MKPVFEKVPRHQWESFHCEVIHGPDYGTRWHFHPEYQITLANRSEGHRIVGDNIAALRDGDLVLVGSNLPHVWHQDESRKHGKAVSAIVIRFLDSFLGAEFLAKPEMEAVRRLFQKSSRGLEITGRTRDEAARLLNVLASADGLGRVVQLLAVLDLLARSKEIKPLASAHYAPALKHEDQDRMERVCDFIHKNLTEDIERGHLAKVAHLSEGAFSRFFRSRTGRTVPEYVNELRIGRACLMLAEERLNITDIGLDCGFRNLANFNRRFRDIMKMTPRDYRRKFAKVSVADAVR
jgi:AraC-like DNA-binding protein